MKILGPSTITASCLAVVLSFGLTACASSGSDSGRSSSRPNVIAAADLVEFSGITALEAVRRLRPRWLQSRGNSSSSLGPPRVAVIVDGLPVGGMSGLSDYPVEEVESLVYMSPSDATTRYGTGYAGGAIVLTRKRR